MPEIIKCSLLLVTPTNLCHCLYLHTSAASEKNDIKHIRKIIINSRKSLLGKVRQLRTSCKFGHTFANSEKPDETALNEPSHQDFHCLLS